MTEPQRKELPLSNAIIVIFRWLALVAAIALGVVLGLYWFFHMVGQQMQHDMQGIWTTPSSIEMPTWTTPTP